MSFNIGSTNTKYFLHNTYNSKPNLGWRFMSECTGRLLGPGALKRTTPFRALEEFNCSFWLDWSKWVAISSLLLLAVPVSVSMVGLEKS